MGTTSSGMLSAKRWKFRSCVWAFWRRWRCFVRLSVRQMLHEIWCEDGREFSEEARMLAGGHMTESPSSLTQSSVISRDSVRVTITIAALNGLSTWSCDIRNAYLTATCREKIWTVAYPKFGSRRGQKMIIIRALYGLKSSGAAFRAFLSEVLYDIGYVPSLAHPMYDFDQPSNRMM